MTTSTTPRHHRPRHLAHLPAPAVQLRLAVARWALRTGHQINYDALTVILAAKAEQPSPLTKFCEDDVWQLWWADLTAWCHRHRVQSPDGLGVTLYNLFEYLHETGQFHPKSDTYRSLVIAMEGAGALSGSSSVAPAS